MNRLVKMDIRVLFVKWHFMINCICTLITAAMTVFIIYLFKEQSEILEKDMADIVHHFNGINMFVIRIDNLDELQNLSAVDVMYKSLSGYFFPIQISINSILFISYCYKKGIIRFSAAKGYSRAEIFMSKVLVCILSNMISLFVYVIGTFFMASFFFRKGNMQRSTFLKFLLFETVIFSIYCAMCSSIMIIFKNEVAAILMALSCVVGIPEIINYIYLFSKGKLEFNNMWLLNYAMQISYHNQYPGFFGILICIGYLMIAMATGIVIFRNEEIK